jgi:hypothetical protein
MQKRIAGILFCALAFTINALAQTVTGAGTTNAIPVFTGSSTLGNSVITQSGGNIWIGTTPAAWPNLEILNLWGSGNSNLAIGTTNYGILIGMAAGAWHGVNNPFVIQPGGISTTAHPIIITSIQNNATAGLMVDSSGNIGMGTISPGAKLEVDGNVKLTAGSGASITFADGTVQSTAYTGVTCGGDYAESVDVAGVRTSYEPGDVLVIGPDSGSDVVKSSAPYSTLVTGIYSTKPGVVGRRQTTDLKISKTEVPMAMIGIVPTKVSDENGSIKRGDLLVTSSIPGYAMKGTDHSRMLGAVIGKALGTLEFGTGLIEIVVTLQ